MLLPDSRDSRLACHMAFEALKPTSNFASGIVNYLTHKLTLQNAFRRNHLKRTLKTRSDSVLPVQMKPVTTLLFMNSNKPLSVGNSCGSIISTNKSDC